MRVLVIGAAGQLGVDLCAAFSNEALYRADLDGSDITLDVCDQSAVQRIIHDLRPDIVVNTAAEHEVEQCETKPARAFMVNATGALWVAQACAQTGARLLHISTDYVFGGAPPQPLRPYGEDDPPAPLNVYGASKCAGEHLIAAICPDYLIVRTAALYGLAPCRGKGGRNFVETMLSLAAAGREIKVVTDVFTSPTCTLALARQLRLLAEKARPGVYHAACTGVCSWYEFAKAIFEETNVQTTVTPAKMADFQSKVRRPNFVALENKRANEAGINIMSHWREALTEYAAARRLSTRATAP